ncbi:MAG: hypothetical protein WAT79_16420 [Saprospiraceae bacterium]
MTLGDFFQAVSEQPSVVLFYFVAMPLTAFLAGVLGKNEGHLSPWNYLYSFLIYAVSIPGIFAISLAIYRFLFERGSIMDTNIYTQILPILTMFLTYTIIRRNVSFREIPGFGRISQLIFMLSLLIIFMWILEKTHILVITFLPFWQFIMFFVGILVLLRFTWMRMFR